MSYYQSSKGIKITKQRALQELANHGIVDSDVSLFLEEMGDKAEYNAESVLRWLGY